MFVDRRGSRGKTLSILFAMDLLVQHDQMIVDVHPIGMQFMKLVEAAKWIGSSMEGEERTKSFK